MSDELPGIGQPVTLRDEGGADHLSRVEGVDDDRLQVVRPDDLHVDDLLDTGAELVVLWASASGLRALPTLLVDTSTTRLLRLWHLEVSGPGWAEQRRNFVRVPVSGQVIIEEELLDAAPVRAAMLSPRFITDDEADTLIAVPDAGADDAVDPAALEGLLIDISEAALAAQVNADPADPRLSSGALVVTRFRLRGEEFVLPATIHSTHSLNRGREFRVVAVFRHGDGHADRIRQHVFAIQREMMQARRR